MKHIKKFNQKIDIINEEMDDEQRKRMLQKFSDAAKKRKSLVPINKEVEFLSKDDITDIFIDLIDEDYKIKFLDNKHSIGKYYVEFRKDFNEEYFDYIDLYSAYGNTNLDKIKKEIDFIIEVLEKSKDRLNDMNYTIGYEFEFTFSAGSMISVVCRIQHSKYDNEN
jgi:hypothetical protein